MKDLKSLFYKHLAQTSPYALALEIEKAEGIYLYGTNGKQYMDLISGLAVCNVGHRHPKVLNAIREQLDRYMHVIPYGEFVLSPQVRLVEKLLSVLPSFFDNVYLVNSGTEANEGAMKLVKRFTGRREIISFDKSYHGCTQGSLSISGNEYKKNAFRPLIPGVKFLRFNSSEDLDKITEKTAGVIIEPVQGDAGVRIPGKIFMQKLRSRCTDMGALLIFDEVQTGFGRTGKMFAFEHFGIIPDILTLAKAFGGGMPIGAFVSSRKIMTSLSHDPKLGHITTFGGHPVVCAAALANLEVIIEEKLVESVEEKGMLFEKLLKHAAIKEFRRIGLMMAIEFENEDLVQKIVLRCLEKGVITFWFLSNSNSFRLSPPLTISIDEIKMACNKINESINEVFV
jgi:acetylornithine/succinyldiaminopimelate/putrescine aminotransferase